MEKITYGASDLMDWIAQIKVGAASVRVHFTGGTLTAYGITPAEYTTSDPFIQKVIERSSYFQEGRITILRRVTIKDDRNQLAKAQGRRQGAKTRNSNNKTLDGAAEASREATDNTPQAGLALTETEGLALTETEGLALTDRPEGPRLAGASLDGDADGNADTALREEPLEDIKRIEVSCLQDAQAYLQENFNISSYKVRSYESAQKAASEHGVRFTGAKFDTPLD